MTAAKLQPPFAEQHPVSSTTHGETRADPYFWLRERDNPAVRAYLEAENAYLEAALSGEETLQEELYRDMLARIQQTDEQPPAPWGPYQYYSRTQEGQSYPVYCRRTPGGPEQVLLDPNELAREHPYVSVGTLQPNFDHTVIAYTLDTSGGERYTLRFKDLAGGQDLPDQVEDVAGYTFAWSQDGTHGFYIRNDAAWRPFELYRHRLGAPTSQDAPIYREEDETFRLYVSRSDSGEYLLLSSGSTKTDEVRYLRANDPQGEWRVFAPRERGVEYGVQDGGGGWLILTNEGGAVNFKLMTAPREDTRREAWRDLLPHRSEVMLSGMKVFARHLVLSGREGGLTQLWVARRDELARGAAAFRRVAFPEDVYTALLGENHEFDTDTARVVYTSLTTPVTYYDLNLDSLGLTLVKRTPVLGGFQSADYVAERLWATAQDGTRVPISLVSRKGTEKPANLFLTAYGSYGFPSDPSFSAARLALLDRGWIFAIAHVRGGGELGRPWYESGKLRFKMNTFADFIACAERLIGEGYTTPRQLVVNGGSAGGLLMGAVTNLRPDLFRAVIADVPFVDVINTMLDASIPLTTLEYDEWGNPNDAGDYAYMRAYSPYDNVERKVYPHLFVTTGLNDPRVAYWEPAKWVARLRTHSEGGKIFLRTNFGAGHGGASGRYDALRELAQEFAFATAAVAGRLDG